MEDFSQALERGAVGFRAPRDTRSFLEFMQQRYLGFCQKASEESGPSARRALQRSCRCYFAILPGRSRRAKQALTLPTFDEFVESLKSTDWRDRMMALDLLSR